MTDDTWNSRDLPVLRAVVDYFEEKGGGIAKLNRLAEMTGMDEEAVMKAARALNREPYFELKGEFFGGGFMGVGAPTGNALRVAGQWPTPEAQLERLIAALEQSAEDDNLPAEEQSKRKRTAAFLRTTAYQLALNALGGAGGNMIGGAFS